jgi:PPK2 family polyphosphate:nucleotide phosphotransferase
MSKDLLWKVAEGSKVKLKDYDPNYSGGLLKQDEAEAELVKLGAELSELQELLAAAQHQSLLIILQGMDTSGKDGTIRHVFSYINPQGCAVTSFKEPTAEESAHDFLWRVHKVTPGKGSMGIFNRSQYEDVLVVRVHNLIPEEEWNQHYKEINHFERLLAHNDTLILKFFLHISKEEQKQRLIAREQNRDKAWKISASDWSERKYWDAYQEAYEDALSKCSTDDAPWYIVPANHKWYRNLAVARTVVDTLHKYKDEWKKDLEARGQKELEALKQVRKNVE